MTTKDAIEQYLSHLQLGNKSENTVRSYRRDLMELLAHTAYVDLAEIGSEHIEGCLAAMHARNLKKASVRRFIACLKSFFSWAESEDLISASPVDGFDGPRVPGRVVRIASEPEMQKMFEHAPRTPFPERDRLILELLYGSGLRAEEVANIGVDDLVETDVLLVADGKGSKQRYVLLTDYAKRLWRIYLRKRNRILARRGLNHKGLFFGLAGSIEPFTVKSVHRIVTGISSDVGLSWISPHVLRRSFATHLDIYGCPRIVISRLLGHARLSTTDLYIASASPERLKTVYQRARAAIANVSA